MLTTIVLRRLLFAIPTLLGVASLAFILGHLTPGDPAVAAMGLDIEGISMVQPDELARVRHELGLDRPVPVQYAMWLGNVLQGDFGRSFVSNMEVAELVWEALPNTLLLLVVTMGVAAVIGISLGIVSAVYRGRAADLIARLITIAGVSTPVFWFAIVLILVFSFRLDMFPMNGRVAEEGWSALVLPVAAIALHPAALIARMMRSSMLEVLSQDMVRTATAKGLGRGRIFLVHALRNAINPVITVIGFQFANLLGGAVAVEAIFAMPGIGSLLIDSILDKDLLLMQGTVLVTGVVFCLTNLFVDLLLMVIDPRIRL